MNKGKVIAWWSGGITSAVTCKLCIDLYGKDNVRIIFIDTKNEDDDTYRFMIDCEKWYGIEIETISRIGEGKGMFESIQDCWTKFKSLNVAKGAICSAELKRVVREQWQRENEFRHQAFGFEIDEVRRVKSMKLNHEKAKPIFPLMMYGYSKKDCIDIVSDAGIDVPRAYTWGFNNNNCLKTGCVQGGIGYWQKMMRERPDLFDNMAEMEHKLTELRGAPVTMNKDQGKKAKEEVKSTGDKTRAFVFLKPHPDYPHIKDISQMEGREPKPLVECNGFCGTMDLSPKNETAEEINFDEDGQTKLEL
jgi:hypothetical protein